MRIRPNFKLWLEIDGKSVLGTGRVQLLKAIDETGSLSKAARKLGISYRHAFQLTHDLNERCGRTLIESSIGGPGGGGMKLTAFGRDLIGRYEAASARIVSALREKGAPPG